MSRGPIADLAGLPLLPPGSTLIDSHCHLDIDGLGDDSEAVIARAVGVGVTRMITVGASHGLESNHRAAALAESHGELYASVGIHPHEASRVTEAVLSEIAGLARPPRVVAIGETGLDYHYDLSPRDVQRSAFRSFVALARSCSLPLIVHLRHADDDALAILRDEHAGEIGGVIHCFSSDAPAARAFLDLGFHLSFSGILTFKTAESVRAAAKVTPVDRLLIETDAPFLAPIPFRGRRNEPALIVQTAAVLGDVRGEPLAAIAAHTRANTERLFRL